MATRQFVQNQREALKQSLRLACQENRLRPGDAAPSLRQLGEEFSLSQGVVVTALRELVDEGLFHTIERLGTFVGPPRPKERPLYVLINERLETRYAQLRGGFEERIASLGGSVMTVEKEQARQLLRDNKFPDCAGVFELAMCVEAAVRDLRALSVEVKSPAVSSHVYMSDKTTDARCDTVSFDDNSGGRLATEHLITAEHERIAFLGIHQNPESCRLESCVPDWSCWREQGWQKALHDAHLSSENLAFYARARWDYDRNFAQLENECVESFLGAFIGALNTDAEITAAVVVNDELAACLLEKMRAAGIARSSWPAIVSFDGESQVQNDVVTSLRLPWEKLGKTAAEMLWERSHGIVIGAPIHRAVPMRLIPRLSCRTDWNALAMAG